MSETIQQHAGCLLEQTQQDIAQRADALLGTQTASLLSVATEAGRITSKEVSVELQFRDPTELEETRNDLRALHIVRNQLVIGGEVLRTTYQLHHMQPLMFDEDARAYIDVASFEFTVREPQIEMPKSRIITLLPPRVSLDETVVDAADYDELLHLEEQYERNYEAQKNQQDDITKLAEGREVPAVPKIDADEQERLKRQAQQNKIQMVNEQYDWLLQLLESNEVGRARRMVGRCQWFTQATVKKVPKSAYYF